ncbi:MAG: hypothetical protein NTNFB02_10480 [Nitrospira sp.]
MLNRDPRPAADIVRAVLFFFASTVGLTACGEGGNVSAPPADAPAGTAPIANAGPNLVNIPAGSPITLNGSASTDPLGHSLAYNWTLVSKPAGSGADLANPTSVSPSFTVDRDGIYKAQLVVNNGVQNSAPDTVNISTMNEPPVANAGPDQGVKALGSLITLNGSTSSDPNGDPLTYSWTLLSKPAGSGADLANPTSAAPSFTVDRDGTYTAQLIVNDGRQNSAPDTVKISTANVPPVANAGSDQTGKALGSLITLNGSASSDPNGDPLTYNWTLVSKPAGSGADLPNPTSASPSFTVDRDGTYTVQLVVNDGTQNSAPDNVNITTVNEPPVAKAGPDQTGKALGSLITLNGSASSDPNGDPLTYNWTLVSKPAGSGADLPNPTSAAPSFTVDRDGTYTVQLVVNDGTQNSAPDSVIITTVTNGGTVRQTLAADNFNRPDSADLGSAWGSGYTDKVPAMIVSQQVRAIDTNLADPKSAESYNAVAPPSDQWCQVTLGTWTGSEDRELGCILRAQPAPTVDWYWCYARANGARNAAIVSHHPGGAGDTNLASDFSVEWAAGDKLRCEAQGTSLRLYRLPAGTTTETLLLSATDGEFTSGRAGLLLWMKTGGDLSHATVDDFSMGQF